MSANTTTTTKATSTEAPTAKPTPCRCGCGQATVRAEANYRSGHDARHAGQVGRTLVEAYKAETLTTKGRTETLAALPTQALKAKAEGLLDRFIATEAEKAANKAAREVAKAAYDQAMAAARA